MNDTFLHKKNELLNWIISLEDEELIKKLTDFKEVINPINRVAEPKAEYTIAKDNFDERFAKGVSHEEMKRRTKEYISNLPWKK